MRAEARGVTGTTHVSEKDAGFGIAQVQFCLEAAVVNVALGQSVSDQDDTLSLCRCRRHLGAGFRRRRRIDFGRMGSTVAAVIGSLFFLGLGRLPGFRRSFDLRNLEIRSRGALAQSVVGRLAIELFVVGGIETGVERGLEGIDVGDIQLIGHLHTEEMVDRIPRETAQVFIRIIDRGAQRGAEGLPLRRAIRRGVFAQPRQRHHRVVLFSGDRLGRGVERLRHFGAQQDCGLSLIEIGNAVDIRGRKNLADSAQDVM